jgi:hypothetical protein
VCFGVVSRAVFCCGVLCIVWCMCVCGVCRGVCSVLSVWCVACGVFVLCVWVDFVFKCRLTSVGHLNLRGLAVRQVPTLESGSRRHVVLSFQVSTPGCWTLDPRGSCVYQVSPWHFLLFALGDGCQGGLSRLGVFCWPLAWLGEGALKDSWGPRETPGCLPIGESVHEHG